MSAEAKQNHALEQAKTQLGSIVEMVAALDRERAMVAYVKELSDEEIQELAVEASVIEPEDEEKETDIESLRERVLWEVENSGFEPSAFEFDEDEARQTIQEDALSVQVRSGWYTLGEDQPEPEEFEILLCTGGPAVRIVGDLNSGSPDRPRLEYQDWFTSWTEYFPPTEQERDALQTYCEQFYFGE